MATIALDTQRTIMLLKERGFSQDQAEGVVDALRETGFVTDTMLDTRLSDLRADIYRAMMIQGGVTVSILTAIIALFFGG